MTAPPSVRRHGAPIAVALVLLVVYGLTLARDVTFWDAGEFIAAASTFGIPHPPGTPLYVMLLRSALMVLGTVGVPAAVATSLVSAGCTAGACATGAALLARSTGDRAGAVAGGLTAGVMSSVWLNASETEVYAASLALSLAIVWTAERAGRLRSVRWTVLTCYLVVLAVPLHLSTLLAAPAAGYFLLGREAREPAGRVRALLGAACVLLAFALGTMRPFAAAAGGVALAGAGLLAARGRDTGSARGAALPLGALAVAVVAASALLVLLLRAQHDPAINQGNPVSWATLADVVARRQYAVAALWPRQAPLWLQGANVLHYADWQVALSLGPTIFPTPLRTAATLVFVALALYGARAHQRLDRRGFAAVGLLLAAGTLGAALYLNLRAGPSFGHGILPEGAVREARERDYFFVLGWWAWGLWAGFGGVAAARRFRLPAWAGLAVPAMPLLLNWTSVDRTRLPGAVLPRLTAEALLEPLPRGAVLFVAGDNDTYPLWYAQRTLGVRRDVTVITMPLLPADWYRAELVRRHRLLAAEAKPAWRGRNAAIREIALHARRNGRSVAMAVSVSAADRAVAGGRWQLRGAAYVEAGVTAPAPLTVDTAAAAAWQARLESATRGLAPGPSTDGTTRYMMAILRCPGIALAHQRAGRTTAESDSLAPRCNFR